MATTTHKTALTTTTNAAIYTTAGFTPALGDLLVVLVVAASTIDDGAVTASANGISTFTRVDRAIFNLSNHSAYIFIADQLAAGTASMTVTFDCTGDDAGGAVVQVAAVSGMTRTGIDAVRQHAKLDNGDGPSTPVFTFSSACLTSNPTLVCLGQISTAGSTPPTNWSEGSDTSFSTPTIGGTYVYRDSGFTGTTITWGDSETANGGIAIELDTTDPGETEYWLPSSGSAAVSPAPSAFWDQADSAVWRPMVISPSNTSIVAADAAYVAEVSATSPWDVLIRQYVSDPIGAQDVEGKFSFVAKALESAGTNDMFVQLRLSVISGDGTSERGVLYAGTEATALAATASTPNQEMSSGGTRVYSRMIMSTVSALNGDRLRLEVGYRSLNVISTSRSGGVEQGDPTSGTDYSLISDSAGNRPFLKLHSIISPAAPSADFSGWGIPI
jgi:hypothetical protein